MNITKREHSKLHAVITIEVSAKDVEKNVEKVFFLRYLTKIGYFFRKNKTNSISLTIKAFQRRFRQELINGLIDKECLLISKNLTKNLK